MLGFQTTTVAVSLAAMRERASLPANTRQHVPVVLLGVLATLGAASGFVLTPGNTTIASGLPGRAQRWTTPASSSSSEGLGKGLAYVIDASFCDQMVPLFPENEGLFGLITMVDCTELKAAIGRAMATWSANHQLISFTDITDTSTCGASASGTLNDTCPWEVFVTTGSGETYGGLAAYVVNERASSFDTVPQWWYLWTRSPAGVEQQLVDQMRRSRVTLQRHICWYLDPTFCASLSGMSDGGKLLLRLVLFSAFSAALVRLCLILVSVAFCLLCARDAGEDDDETVLPCISCEKDPPSGAAAPSRARARAPAHILILHPARGGATSSPRETESCTL